MTGSLWTWASSLIGGLLAFGLELTLLIVALTTVHKRRPEAGALLAGAAAVQMARTILAPIGFALIAQMGSTMDYMQRSAMLQLVLAVLNAVGGGLLIV